MSGAGIPLPTESEFCVVSRRNDSLGSRWRWRLFGSLCAVSFGLGLGFAAFGAWMVLPYSALEMAVLYLAFRWFERHAADWERVSVCGDRVVVERERAGVHTRREFNRFWARVEVDEGVLNRAPRLALRFAGERVASATSCPLKNGWRSRVSCDEPSRCARQYPEAGGSDVFEASMRGEGAMARGMSNKKTLRAPRLAVLWASAILSALMPAAALAAKEYNLQPPVTPVATQIFELHTFIMWICVVIFVAVFSVMFYSIFAHRKSKGHQAAQFHENTLVEVVWTVIPFLILLFMAFPATRTVLAMKDSTDADMTVKVTGSQWKWSYDYLDDGFGFYSNLKTPLAQIENHEPKGEHYLLEVDQPLVVPVNKKIRLLITSADVIHAWFLPAAGLQQDAIPGFVRDDWMKFDKPGVYRGQCAKICGKEHGFMPIVVDVLSADDYAKWRDEHKKMAAAAADDPNKVWDQKELIARGEKVFGANCAACHQANGKGVPGAFPALDGSKVVTGPKDAQIKTVLNGVVKNGQPTAMVAWKNTLSDADIAAVVTYTRNSWSNHTGEAIQPSEVKAAKGSG